jgi:ribosomal protein L7Ae-like RNA K-turn-binding protein
MLQHELGLLGLAMRGGSVVRGTGGVRAALQRDELALVVVAHDCSSRTEEKVVRLARKKGVRMLQGPDAIELGRRLGRRSLQVVGVRDVRLAAGFGVGGGK